MRIATISLLLVLAGVAASAQVAPPGGGEVSLAELLREDGSIDMDRPMDGTVDLTGFDVYMHADGSIRATAEGDWLPGEQSLGLNGYLSALAWGPDGALYVGGVFHSVGGLSDVHRLARWTPSEGTGGTWSGLGFTGYSVNVLAWGPDGALYVGGSFDSTGGVEGTRSIARWTPTGGSSGEWTALGSGLSSVVYSLAWGPDGALYAGGLFTSAGDAGAINRIARWTPDSDTGGEWSALGSGTSGTVWSLSWGPDGNLYVGGGFSEAGGIPGTDNIARWTPSANTEGTWSALGEGVSGGHSLVNAVFALSWSPDGALYVGGGFASASGVEGTRGIARWTPNSETGGEWSAIGQGHIIGEGLNRIRTLSWGSDGALYVGGHFQTAGGTPGANHIAQWNPNVGSNGEWSALGPGVSAVVHAIAWGSDGLYVGGEYINAGGIPGTSRIARWTDSTDNAGAWSALGTSLSEAVYALAWGPDGALYVGGLFTSAGGVQGVNRIARWTPSGTGGTWSALGTGTNALVYALVWGPDGALYAGGHFSTAGGVPGTSGVARWTPSGETDGTWSALGTGVNSWVNALSWGPDGALYVGGTFTSAGEASGADRIARWTSHSHVAYRQQRDGKPRAPTELPVGLLPSVQAGFGVLLARERTLGCGRWLGVRTAPFMPAVRLHRLAGLRGRATSPGGRPQMAYPENGVRLEPSWTLGSGP